MFCRRALRAHVPDRAVRAFGSRVSSTREPMSDLDLCITSSERPPPARLERLRLAFSESPLPMKVGIADWADLTAGFRAIIQAHSTVIQRPR